MRADRLFSLAILLQTRGRLLASGRAVEVFEPSSLRLSLVDFGVQGVDFYRRL